MNDPGQFFFVACQGGSENVCKSQMQSARPDARLAFSRPGFLTYKVESPNPLPEDLQLKNAFVRTAGVCLQRVDGKSIDELASSFWEAVKDQRWRQLHVWSRLPELAGGKPGSGSSRGPAVEPALAALTGNRPPEIAAVSINGVAAPGERVLNCILVDDGQWWVGVHRAAATPTRWPGGVPPFQPPEQMISRAYLKMREALAWSQMPIASGDICFEIGSSPGGAAQALLEAGLQVIGVDPAEMDERVMQHESFSHIRKRGRDVKRRDFAAAKWLVVDSNVAPEQTLDTVRDIVTHDSVRIRGMLLTLKFPKWSAAGALDDYLARIREWGFQHVKPRQLAYNRQEVCVAAFKNRSMRRFAGGQRKKH